jgi:hypothetical protein
MVMSPTCTVLSFRGPWSIPQELIAYLHSQVFLQKRLYVIFFKVLLSPLTCSDSQHRICINNFRVIGDGDDDTTVSGLRCYTDGSLMGNAGSGVAIFRQMDRNPIYTNGRYVGMVTVFQAEVHAIQMACNQASTYQDTRVTIFSDS